MTLKHSFHIPVMGIGYTIDTPVKVAHLGIDSSISLVDDILVEKMRKFYSEKFEIPYQEISHKIEDFRAKRITSYLNLMKDIAENKLEELKSAGLEKKEELKEYFQLLPDHSELKKEFRQKWDSFNLKDMKAWLKDHLHLGEMDVNITTKVDKDNYKNGEKLPVEFNDAHAALRGFAESKLNSSVVLSAGMNPRLFNYMPQFPDFFPSELGELKKKIILKVSDFRSALIQGKYLAKKGLWVSEYRIESGLNCGGHAFASDGVLLGPVLEEFKSKRDQLRTEIWNVLSGALKNLGKVVPNEVLALKVSAQGGVGTAEEHDFLMDHYALNSVGWGSPFLLVPQATSVDKNTRLQLAQAKENDIYLSGISPLGIPFNSLKGNTKDIEKRSLIDKGKPGSLCPKRYVELNYEYSEKGLCTASYRYQRLKLKELDQLNLSEEDKQKQFRIITDKSCVCVGLGTSALLEKDLDTKVEGPGVSVCPGPNLAYYDKEISLQEMVGHIYGRNNIIERTDRPHMFLKELQLYIDYFKNKVEEVKTDFNKKQANSLMTFNENLKQGVEYYQQLFNGIKSRFLNSKAQILKDLEQHQQMIEELKQELRKKMALD